MTSALIVIDFQRDFCKGGSLANDDADSIIPRVNEIICDFMNQSLPIIYTFDWHPEKTPHFDKWPVHCVQGTDGASIHPGIIYPDDYFPMGIVRKGLGQDDGYSAFSTPAHAVRFGDKEVENFNNLEELLTSLKVTDILVVGLLVDYCVGRTAIDAIDHGYNVTVDAGATAYHKLETLIDMVDEMKAVGVTLTDIR